MSPLEEPLQESLLGGADISTEDASGEQEVRLRLAAKHASKKNPQHHAEVLKLAEKMGLAPAIVERNFDLVKQRADSMDAAYKRMGRETPKTAAFLSDPDNAAIAKDDHDQLGTLEHLLNLGKSFAGSGIRGTGDALSGLGNLF